MSLGIVYMTSMRRDSKGIAHAAPAVPVFRESLKGYGNYGEIRRMEDVTGIVVNADENRIVQASGYSAERGMFCDLY